MELLSDIQHSGWGLEQSSKVKMRQIFFFIKNLEQPGFLRGCIKEGF